MEAHHPCALVSWEDNKWSVVVDERIHSEHKTKQAAIDNAKDVDGVNKVMAFTKGNSGFQTHRA